MRRILLQSLLALLALTVVTGIIYPLLVTAIVELCCRAQAQGSLIERNGRLLGSALIGQPFDQPRYFWGRPSATTPQPYNGASSGGSNLGPTNPAQFDAVRARVAALQHADPANRICRSLSIWSPPRPAASIPTSVRRPRSIRLRASARARGIDPARLRALIAAHTQRRQWVILGEQRVNVLELNLALDQLR